MQHVMLVLLKIFNIYLTSVYGIMQQLILSLEIHLLHIWMETFPFAVSVELHLVIISKYIYKFIKNITFGQVKWVLFSRNILFPFWVVTWCETGFFFFVLAQFPPTLFSKSVDFNYWLFPLFIPSTVHTFSSCFPL